MHFCDITDIASQEEIDWLVDILNANRTIVGTLIKDIVVTDHLTKLDKWLKILEGHQ